MGSLERTNITPKEFLPTLSSLIEKIFRGSKGYSKDFLKNIADFVNLTRVPYVPGREFSNRIKQRLEETTQRVTYNAESPESGRCEPWGSLQGLCTWGIIAKHLGIQYDFDPALLPIIDFELHHFDYEREFRNFGNFSPLDLIYFAKINDQAEFLEGRQINPLDERCRNVEIRKATPDEIRKKISDTTIEMNQMLDEEMPAYQREINFLNGVLSEGDKYVDSKDIMDSISWEVNPKLVVYTHVFPKEKVPRKPHTPAQVKEFLGKRLEDALLQYHQQGEQEKATEILHRRNRVKDFLGGDIKIPPELAGHDDAYFVGLDPREISMWIDNMVTVWGPQDMRSELALPSSLTAKEYRLYRNIVKAIEILRRGTLSYDTPEKRLLLINTDLPALQKGIAQKLLPYLRK